MFCFHYDDIWVLDTLFLFVGGWRHRTLSLLLSFLYQSVFIFFIYEFVDYLATRTKLIQNFFLLNPTSFICEQKLTKAFWFKFIFRFKSVASCHEVINCVLVSWNTGLDWTSFRYYFLLPAILIHSKADAFMHFHSVEPANVKKDTFWHYWVLVSNSITIIFLVCSLIRTLSFIWLVSISG